MADAEVGDGETVHGAGVGRTIGARLAEDRHAALDLGVEIDAPACALPVGSDRQGIVRRIGQVGFRGAEVRETGEEAHAAADLLLDADLAAIDHIAAHIEPGRRRREGEDVPISHMILEDRHVDGGILARLPGRADLAMVHLLGREVPEGAGEGGHQVRQDRRVDAGEVDPLRDVRAEGEVLAVRQHRAHVRRVLVAVLVMMVGPDSRRGSERPAVGQDDRLAETDVRRRQREVAGIKPDGRDGAAQTVDVQSEAELAALPQLGFLAETHAGHGETGVQAGILQPFAVVVVDLDRAFQPFEVMGEGQRRQGAAGVVLVALVGERDDVTRVAGGILDGQGQDADRPMVVQLIPHMAHEVGQATVGGRTLPVGIRVTLRERIIDRALAAGEVGLLDPRVEAATRNLGVAGDTLRLAGGLRRQVDRGEGVAELLRLGALVDLDLAHAVGRQQVEQRVVPCRHVERDAVDVGLDLGTRAAAAHAAHEDGAAFDVAIGTDRVEARDADARGHPERGGEVNRVQVADLVGGDGGDVAAELVDGIAVDDRRSRDDHRGHGGRRSRGSLRQRIRGEGGDTERKRGEEELGLEFHVMVFRLLVFGLGLEMRRTINGRRRPSGGIPPSCLPSSDGPWAEPSPDRPRRSEAPARIRPTGRGCRRIRGREA